MINITVTENQAFAILMALENMRDRASKSDAPLARPAYIIFREVFEHVKCQCPKDILNDR